ncbi:MAG: GNAT family N-acetyltransferase [Prevotella sp.]|nr:GNAT family N-acetyltransferase [Prevotella sp.]
MIIQRYDNRMQQSWDEFVARSRNATFLHYRDYMDYHSNRFHDHSLIFLSDKGKIVALLPANAAGETLYSHQGLTYGGMLVSMKSTAKEVIEAFRLLTNYAKEQDFKKIIYKPVPSLYHRYPCEEDLYALFYATHSALECRNISSVIDFRQPLTWSQNRRLGVNRAKRNGLYVKESDDFSAFWKILEDNLRERYNAAPVHSLAEITMLKTRFPDHIRLFMAYDSCHCPQAGTLIYDSNGVAHSQYISSTSVGKESHAVDLLFSEVIHHYAPTHRYFDLGTSNEQGGTYLNESLIHQKEGFGARAIIYDAWAITL